MKPIRWFIEAMVDLVWPREEGDPPLSFRQKAIAFGPLIFIILFAVRVSR